MGWSVEQRMGLTRHHPSLSFKGYTLAIPLAPHEIATHEITFTRARV